MAAPFSFNNLVLKVLADPEFRQAVQRNPAKALRSIKAKATKKQVAALKALDWDGLEKVYSAFQAGVHPDTFS